MWSWDPLKLCDVTAAPPQPRPGKILAGQDPEARIRHFKSPQQRSDQTDKPVNSEQDSCSFDSNHDLLGVGSSYIPAGPVTPGHSLLGRPQRLRPAIST